MTSRSAVSRALVVVVSLVALSSCPHAPPVTPPLTPPVIPPVPLTGWVDLHTHPMASLGFAGKLLYGGADWASDGGALLPSDPECNRDVRAISADQALGHDKSTHGEWGFHNTCGDTIRSLVVSTLQEMNRGNDPPPDAFGAPAFAEWPMNNDVTHQVMWVESVRRAYDAGQRVMVALAVNNKTLADIVAGHTDGPSDDQSSADLQIAELKALVGRHNDFMQVAYSSSDVTSIVSANKLAIVLGLEIDNIGNFNTKNNLTPADIQAELVRLRASGVRYLFPVHLIDNPFGSTAAFEDIFNISNLREAGHFWNLQCAAPSDGVTYRPTMKNPLRDPFSDPQTAQMAALMVFKLHLFSLDDPSPPACPLDGGVVNVGNPFPGLTPNGEYAVREMMRQCMLLDVDHMSQATANYTLSVVVDAGYPINSGHNNVRSVLGGQSERQLVPAQYAMVQSVGGLAGVGAARSDPEKWVAMSHDVLSALGDGGHLAFGTDSNGVSPLMVPPSSGAPMVTYSGSYTMSTLGSKTWDFNDAGVAHYGMLSDFLQAVQQVDGGAAIYANLMTGAGAFRDTWAVAEARCAAMTAVPVPPAPPPSHHHHMLMAAPPQCPAGETFRAACDRCLPLRANCPPCDETDAGTDCLSEPRCPPGRSRNAWGVCSVDPQADNARALEMPVTARLARTPVSGAPMPPGKYLLTMQVANGKATPFVVDLVEKAGAWSLKGKREVVAANGGYMKNLWVLQWKSGKQAVVLMAKPQRPAQSPQQQKAPPAPSGIHGGFAVHRPGAQSVIGEFTLEPAPKKLPAEVQQLEQLPQLLDGLR